MANVNIGQLTWAIKADTSSIDKSIKKTETGLSKFGKAVVAAFSVGALVAFTKKAAELGKQAVNFAADLVESQNAVSVVFGDSAEILDEFGETSVRAVGLTTTAFNELATTIGAQLKQSGLEIDAVADKTIELTQRAADTASIFNVEVNESLQAFGAALRGEAEPARRFGINISDAAVQAEALASGLVSSKNEITDQIKVQARYNLILKQSADFAGDFANTQESFSNQSKIARANIDELSAAIGEGLLPVATSIVTRFNELIEGLIETKTRANELKLALEAQREGEETLEQQLAILINRRNRYTGATRRQKEALDAEIRALEILIERQGSAVAIGREYERSTSDSVETTDEETEAIDDLSDAINELEVARAAAAASLRDGEIENAEFISQLRGEQALARAEAEAAELSAEQERHDQRIANLQSELEFYSGYTQGVGQLFGNLIQIQMAGDNELSESRKRNIIALYRLQQAANIAQIAVDTASAIVRQYKDLPIYLAIPASIITAAIGATQAGIVAATPPPALQDGGVVPATPGGRLVRVAEGGRDEEIRPLDSSGSGGNITIVTMLDGEVVARNTVNRINNGQFAIEADRGVV